MKTKALCMVAVLLLLAWTHQAAADHNPTHAVVGNQSPRVTSIDAPHSVTPLAGGDRTIEVEIEVFEPNGWQDIQRVEITVLRPDNETVLHQFHATPTGPGQGPRRGYHAEFPMPFYEPPATREEGYVIRVVAVDHPGARSDPAYHLFAYEALTAMSLDAQSIQFGEAEPGEASDPVPLAVRNVGNVPLALQASATPLVSQEGHKINESNIRVDATNESYQEGVPLGHAPAPLDGFHLEPGPDSRRTTWWVLKVPTGHDGYVPAGEYAGTIDLEALQDG